MHYLLVSLPIIIIISSNNVEINFFVYHSLGFDKISTIDSINYIPSLQVIYLEAGYKLSDWWTGIKWVMLEHEWCLVYIVSVDQHVVEKHGWSRYYRELDKRPNGILEN